MLFDQIMILLVLVVLSAFFSAAETALFSISMDKAFHFGAQTGRIPTLIQRMKNDPDRFLNTILIGNTLVNMSVASLATAVSLDVVPGHALAIAIGAATFVILIFGEVFPKSVAARNATLIARIVIVTGWSHANARSISAPAAARPLRTRWLSPVPSNEAATDQPSSG